jgi:hypothetical protein
MATFYLDLENGDDANDGTTFANRWKTISNGATAARIAPGDTIRVMGSPAPTSLGINGTWTNGKQEVEFGTYTSTNTTPVVVTYTGHGYSTGDIVMIRSDTGNNINGTWSITVLTANTFELDGSVGTGTSAGGSRRIVRRTAQAVKLASALTQNIASTGYETTAAWTPSANVTSVLDAVNVKEHSASTSISIAAGFTTGKAAYYTLPSTLDLSSYQQVSFWFYQDTGTLSGTAYTLELCTDTTGDTSVHTIQIPSPLNLDRWIPVTVDLATNMNSAIQSIALYVGTDLGAAILKFDNIIACKASSAADSLTLTSLIGKNISTDTFYSIESINGTRVMLGVYNLIDVNDVNHPVYAGVSETVTTYKQETIKVADKALQTIQDSGTAGNLISFEGGWDRTDMSAQTLETWMDGQNGTGTGINAVSKSYIGLNKFAAVRYADGIAISGSGSGWQIGEITVNNNAGEGINFLNSGTADVDTITTIKSASFNGNGVFVSSANTDITTINLANSNTSDGVYLSGDNQRITTISQADGNNQYGIQLARCDNTTIKTITSASGNNNTGVYWLNVTQGVRIGTVTASNNRLYGLYFLGENNGTYVFGGGTSGNGTAGIYNDTVAAYLKNFEITEAIEVDMPAAADTLNHRILSTNHDNAANNHRIFTDGGLISSESSVRHTASGIAWKLQPTNSSVTTGRNERYPLSLSIAKIAVSANNLVTVKAWMRRDNTDLTMKLVCKAWQLAGIGDTDITASMTAAADTWEELTITFTPTETGVVEITAEAYGGSTYTGYVDDLTVTQA